MKAYLVITGALFGLIAVMHLLKSIAERSAFTTDPWYYLGTSALGVVAAALSAQCTPLASDAAPAQTRCSPAGP